MSNLKVLPFSARIDLLRKKEQEQMKLRKEVFDEKKELQEVRKIRENYARRLNAPKKENKP